MLSFLDALRERVLVCDGAMGTMLYSRGVFINKSFDAMNLTQAPLVEAVHQEYVLAGADIIETNTFGANRTKLASFGLADKLREINIAGAQIARRAAGDRAFVAGAMGPLGIRIEPWGKTGVDEAREYFREQAQALVDGGVDLFILETFRDLNEIGAAIDAVRSVSDLPIIAQMTTEEDGNTLDGTPPERFAPELEKRGATIIGVNCAVGPGPDARDHRADGGGDAAEALGAAQRRQAARRRRAQHLPLFARIHGVVRPAVRAAQRSRRRRLLRHDAGAHPADQGRRPRGDAGGPGGNSRPARRREIGARDRRATRAARAEVAPGARRLRAATFVLGVELLPPRGFESEPAIQRARELKRYGVDVVNIPDGLRSGARLSALALALLVEQQAGIETVLHYACRDRNLLGIQSDLLGAHAIGLRNLLLITGDPGRVGDYPDATAVFDVDSIGLTNLVTRLNHGGDIGGQPIGAPTAFHIGVSVNPAASNMDEEFRRFDYKVEAGAEFVVTRPVFDLRGFERFLKRIESGPAAGHRRRLSVRIRPERRVHRQRGAWCAGARGADGSDARAPTATMPPPPKGSPLHGRSRPGFATPCRASRCRPRPATSTPRLGSLMDFADEPDV